MTAAAAVGQTDDEAAYDTAFGFQIPRAPLSSNEARLMASWLEGAADMLRFRALDKTITSVELGGAEFADLRDLVSVWREHS